MAKCSACHYDERRVCKRIPAEMWKSLSKASKSGVRGVTVSSLGFVELWKLYEVLC